MPPPPAAAAAPAAQARLGPKSLSRAPSSGGGGEPNQEIFILPRQKSRSRERRESRMFLVDGQLCWADDHLGQQQHQQHHLLASSTGKRSSSIHGLMFGSSMDLSGVGVGGQLSMDSSGGAGSGSDEAISYRIKWCRENIVQLKRQCWPMEKKLQVLRASKLFIKQHQGELKQSKQASDVLASTGAIFDRYWRHFKRELANFLVIITPWEMRIKKIESHFGSVVASYFTFLRWIFWLNLANSLVMCSFVMVPELIENVPDLTGMRKGELGSQQELMPTTAPTGGPQQAVASSSGRQFNPTLSEMWEFEGFLKFSPIFYGYYSNVEISRSGFWRNPLAFLLAAMLTYLLCFFCISRKLSQNTKMSRIGSKDDECTFCWTVFVGWDFMIGNSETAYNKTSSLVMNLKEGILEEKEQTKDRDWRLIIRRVFANLLTIMLIVASAYVVTLAVQRSESLPEDASLLQKNELQLVMSGIQFMFPPLFDVIGIIEKYHPRKALSWQLGRILFLDFLNFYTLMFSLFGTVDQMGIQLNEVSGNISQLRRNHTYFRNLFTTTTTTSTTTLRPPDVSTTEATLESMGPVAAPNSTTSNLLNQPQQQQQTTPTTMGSTSGGLGDQTGAPMATAAGQVVLPASSTMMPSPAPAPAPARPPNIEMDSGASGPTGGGGGSQSTPPNDTTTSSSIYLDSTTATTEQATTTTTTSPSATTTLDSEKPAPSPESTIEATTNDDDDYLDLNEALGSADNQRARRRRRRRSRQVATNYDDDDRLASLMQQQQQQQQPQIVGLPPVRDPYAPRSSAPNWSPIDAFAEDQDQEEPLEGRLVASSGRPRWAPASQPTTTRQPRLPAGGGTQPVASRNSARVDQLDSDRDEDLIEAREESSRAGRGGGSTIVYVDPAPTTTTATTFSNDVMASTGAMLSAAVAAAPPVGQPAGGGDDNLRPQSRAGTGFGPTAATSAGSLAQATPGLDSQQQQQQQQVAPLETTTTVSGGGGQSSSSCSPPPPLDSDLNYLTANGTNAHPIQVAGSNATSAPAAAADCVGIPDFKPQEIVALNETLRDKLKSLCWETMFGQEMVKIVVMDLVMTVVSAVSFEFMRACFVRYCNRFFFWDLERGFPGYQDFKLAENVLHLVNNQSTVWMGMFFAPGLPAINTVKLVILMYVRSWAVLTCNIPHETVFKVSKSNNFYYWILLINLLICILPVAYAVTWIRPSWHCGPFGGECRMYLVVTKLLRQLLPPAANSIFQYLSSPGAVIPILISLVLIIYYLASTVSSSKEANKELKAQLKKDKEQEAAVPEITSTTVAEGPAAGGATTAAAANDATTTTITATSLAAAGTLLDPAPLVGATGPSSVAGQHQQQQTSLGAVGDKTRESSRSFLVPPTI